MIQVIDAEMARRKLLEESPIASTQEEPVLFDTSEIPWWAWVRRFHLPEVGHKGVCGAQRHAVPSLLLYQIAIQLFVFAHTHYVLPHFASQQAGVAKQKLSALATMLQAEKINGRVCMVGYAAGYFVDALTGHGLVDQQNSFLGKLLLVITVVGLLVYRNNNALPAYKNLLDEATFYDKQWQATWEGQNRPSESEK